MPRQLLRDRIHAKAELVIRWEAQLVALDPNDRAFAHVDGQARRIRRELAILLVEAIGPDVGGFARRARVKKTELEALMAGERSVTEEEAERIVKAVKE